ncbi:uncharacterized protein [Penaeus vannamei]|uniref:uncharacterized protein n=1 Tax=Penaeus vannamei TaxID=6689 RepID=UPI00387F4E26
MCLRLTPPSGVATCQPTPSVARGGDTSPRDQERRTRSPKLAAMAFALLLLALWAPRLSEGGRPDVSGTGGDSAFILNGTRSARSSTRGIKLVSGCEELPCATFEEGLTVPVPGVVSIKAQTRLPNWNPKLLFEDGDGNKIACVDMKGNQDGIVLSEKRPCNGPPLQFAYIPPILYSEDEWLHVNFSLKVGMTFIDMYKPHSPRDLFIIPVLCQRVQVTECGRFGYSPQSPSIQQTTDNDFPINTNVSNKKTTSSRNDERTLKETEGFPPTTDDPTPFQKADLAHLLLLRVTTGLVFIATTFSSALARQALVSLSVCLNTDKQYVGDATPVPSPAVSQTRAVRRRVSRVSLSLPDDHDRRQADSSLIKQLIPFSLTTGFLLPIASDILCVFPYAGRLRIDRKIPKPSSGMRRERTLPPAQERRTRSLTLAAMAFALLLLALWAPRLSEGGRPDVSGTGGDSAFILNGTRSARSSTPEVNLLYGCEDLPCETFMEGSAAAIPGVVSIKAQTRLPNWNPKLLCEDGDGNKIACVDMKGNQNGIILSEKRPCNGPPLQTAHIPSNFYSEDEWLHVNFSLKDGMTFIDMYKPHSPRKLFMIPALCQRVQVTECEQFGYSPQSPSNQQGTDFPINTNVSKALRPSEGRRPDVLGTGEDSTSFLDSKRPVTLPSTREINSFYGCEDLPCETFEEGSAAAIPGVVSIKAQTGLSNWNPKLLFEDGDGNKVACVDMEANQSGILFSVKLPCDGTLRDSFLLPHNFYVVNEWLHFNISVRVGKTFIDMYEPHKSRNLFRIPLLFQRVQVTECGRFGYSPQLPYVHPTSSAAVNLKETEGFPPTTDDPASFQKADLAHLLLLRVTTGLVFIATTFSITIFSLYLHVRSFVLVL